MSILAVLIEKQDGDSCGISGIDETPQERKRRGGPSPPAESEVLHGNQQPIPTSSCGLFVGLWINLAMSQSFSSLLTQDYQQLQYVL
ncbi:hypothetical protein [Priestia megaterium]|uniref:hypothetical protein n=1 Tax=Priestia megaterium TaxID=1404 RepID=UPI0022B8BE04|nr:hypothetical protein [Priestia megaterium]MCZ8496578.1 hypothetical protein [Priestia megaterium]